MVGGIGREVGSPFFVCHRQSNDMRMAFPVFAIGTPEFANRYRRLEYACKMFYK